MFSRTILHVEMLALEVCCKTKELTKSMQGGRWKEGATNVDTSQQLKCQEREIIGCATRLVQFIDHGDSCPEISNEEESAAGLSDHAAQANAFPPATPPNCQNSSQLDENSLLEPPSCMNTFSDSGIDVTEETKEDQLLRAEEMMNGLSLPTNAAGKSLQSVQDLRETLGNLKRKTDKAVMQFLKRSRHVLQEELGDQNHKDHDEKLLDLISDLLLHQEEGDQKMTEIEVSSDKENPLSVFEKSLCYVLVDKALLNCLLLLDKAQMEGRLINGDLELQNNAKSTGQNLLSVFSQAIQEKRELGETRENKEKKDEVIEKMRCHIRELTSEKLRLENENSSLEEKSRWLTMKSEELEMQNSVIDQERQLLKEKVSVLDESMAGLQSCTEHLRQQIETLEEQKEESRNEKNLLKDQLQSLKEEQKQQLESNSGEKSDEEDTSSQPTISCSASTQTSFSFTGEDVRLHEKDNTEPLNSATSTVHPNDFNKKPESSSSEKDDMKGSFETLTSENEELRAQLQSLQAADKELRAEMAALTYAHGERKDEIQVAKERSKILEQDLDERSTEIVLLQAHVLELKKTNNMAQGTIRKMENNMHLIKEGKDTTDGNNTILRRQKERLKKEVSTLLSQTTTNNGDEQSDNIEELCCNVSSLRKHFVFLRKSVEEKGRTVEYLNERATIGDQRIQQMTELLEELAKRNEVLVNKLEMMGAVTVVRNDFDIPDGYQEAVDGILRSQSSTLEKGVLAMMKVTEEKESERKLLQEQKRRLEYSNEALETENILLKVQVSDLNQTVEELEEDVIHMKCEMNADSRHGRHPGTPKSSGSGGHHVTFGDLGVEKGGGTLQALIETAKRRCVHLERQVRTNTSLLKATDYRNKTLERTSEELGRQNCCFRKRLSDFEQTNKMWKIKVLELQDQLNEAGEGKSLDEMEKQSLGDRLKILEGQTKYLKEEKESLKDQVETLRRESKSSDEMQCLGPKTKYSVLEKEIDEVVSGKTDFKHEMECLKNRVKQQSTHSRILKCEVFEFLDDVRCLECELSCEVERVEVTYKKVTSIQSSSIDTKLVSTWKDETSLCEQEGMAPIMTEILNLMNTVIQRLQSVSSKTDTNERSSDSDLVDSGLVDSGRHQHTLLRERLREETAKLRIEKEQIQREVFAMKAIIEYLLNQTDSPDSSSKAREEERSQKLRRQILVYIERNSLMESEILDFLKQQSELEEELELLKENILNLKGRKDVLLSLNKSNNCHKCCGKSCERVMRNFCFVKHEGHETQGLLKVGSEQDNDDVFSCPSDEGVCHSPDREAGSCDSGYQSTRHDERQSMILGDKVDAGHHIRHVTTRDPSGCNHPGSLGSFYENKSREPKLSEISSTSTPVENKPKSILKKRPPKEEMENFPRKVTREGRNEMSGCKVCNFSDLFKPFKRTTQNEEKLDE